MRLLVVTVLLTAAGAMGIDGRILWDTVGPSGTEYWDDGTGVPTQVN